MACCPLEASDGCSDRVGTTKIVVARKEWACAECREVIAKGQRYEVHKGLTDGDWWYEVRTCLSCVEIRNHFACGSGWLYGQLWEDLEQNFFPDMKAGGPCMAGLSPAAKDRLFTRRMTWLLGDSPHRDGANRGRDHRRVARRQGDDVSTPCGSRHWFSTDPVGHYSYCVRPNGHDDDHTDGGMRWWSVVVSQPAPAPNDGPRVLDLVLADLKARAEAGLAKYGTYLQPNNGRSALQDAYEEALDLAMYLRQKLEEERKA